MMTDMDGWKETIEVVPFDEAVPKVNKNLVEVVRCKDCKHLLEHETGELECEIRAGWFPVKPDWFCADGERRTE